MNISTNPQNQLCDVDFLSEVKRQRKVAEETDYEEGTSQEAKMAKKVLQAIKSASMSLGDDYIIHNEVKDMKKNEVEAYRSEVRKQSMISCNFFPLSFSSIHTIKYMHRPEYSYLYIYIIYMHTLF